VEHRQRGKKDIKETEKKEWVKTMRMDLRGGASTIVALESDTGHFEISSSIG
jgi:hypothetical protein